MSGFTPGPWVYKEFIGKYENELGEIVNTKEKSSTIHVGNEKIFIVGNYGVWCPKTSEYVSNMRLIDAAPDLYVELWNAVQCLTDIVEGRDWGDIEEYIRSAQSALTAARGE